jgi:glycosyltransferase 2 family protein
VKSAKSWLRTAVAFAATAFFLWLALRGVKWPEVVAHLRGANYLLLLAAVVVSTLGMYVRAMRWKPLLAPVRADVPFRPRIAGTFIGFAANNLIPARIGEFARVVVTAREGAMPVSAVFATLVMERVLDGLTCVGLLLGAMALEDFPEGTRVGGVDPVSTARIFAAAALVAGLVLVAMALFPRRAVAAGERMARILPLSFRRPLVDALHAFLGGLGVLRSPRLLLVSAAWALFQWLFLATSFLLAFHAFGITEPGFVGAVFLQSVIALAVSIPSAPGFFGTFEAAARYGLALWGVDETRAVSFAIGFHLGGWLSVTAIGMVFLWRLGLRWRDLRGSEEKVEEEVERDPSLDHPGHVGPGRA